MKWLSYIIAKIKNRCQYTEKWQSGLMCTLHNNQCKYGNEWPCCTAASFYRKYGHLDYKSVKRQKSLDE